jgi:3-dehydroquinate synthase
LKTNHDLNTPIYIEDHDLKTLLEIFKKHVQVRRLFILADAQVASLHQVAVEEVLKNDYQLNWITIPSGETSKNIERYTQIVNVLLEFPIYKDDVIVAFGGGVTGDLAGYIASTILRGVRFIQIPTTLLSMIDSSIGGKVGINMQAGKNLVGAFIEPLFIYSYLPFLKTLPKRELHQGFAEMLKAALIRDEVLFDLMKSSETFCLNWMERAIRVKTSIVKEDPFEHHTRMLLNFGHTLGHAIESQHYEEGMLHGEAVSHGMMFALKVSQTFKGFKKHDIESIQAILQRYQLLSKSIQPYEVYIKKVIHDKKMRQDGIRFIVLKSIGEASIETLSLEQLYGI